MGSLEAVIANASVALAHFSLSSDLKIKTDNSYNFDRNSIEGLDDHKASIINLDFFLILNGLILLEAFNN